MNKIATTAATAVGVAILIVSGLSCSSQPAPKPAEKQIVTVQRGNLAVITSVDGKLVMPQAFDLRFGAPGNVRDVLVEEGDFVRAGAILAKLDDTPQQLDIKSANSALQLKLSDLYETVQRIHYLYETTPGSQSITGYYPRYSQNVSALLSMGWAREEVSKAYDLFLLSNYAEALSELRIAIVDLESCIKIFQDGIEISHFDLGKEPQNTEQLEMSYIGEFQKVIHLIKQKKTELEMVQTLIAQGNYVAASKALKDSLNELEEINLETVNSKLYTTEVYYNQSYPSLNISLYFFRVAEDKLNQALAIVEKGEPNSATYNENLRTARHYIELCNSILGSSVLVLEHGLSLKNYQQYNVNVATAAVTLANSKDTLLKTVIVAPFDGTVVSVGIKKNDVLSAIDYSSRGTIQLVDTTDIKFQGQVDEIDILKIKVGQKATIAVDAVTDRVFTGRVTFISPFGSVGTGTVVKFPITIKFDPTDVPLKGSLTATADIAVSSVENVLLVPASAVTTTPAGSFVNVVIGAKGETERRQVTIGSQNQQFAEVVSGLKEGDKVVIEAAAAAPIVTRPTGPPPPPR